MKLCSRFFALVCAATVSLTTPLFGGPAQKGTLTFVQPDGTSFSATVSGDEFGHVKRTLDGCAIVQDSDGWWCYASFDSEGARTSTGIRVGSKTTAGVDAASAISASRNIPYGKIAAKAAERRSSVEELQSSEGEPILKRIMKANGTSPLTKTDVSSNIKHGIVILAQFSDVSFSNSRNAFVNMLTQSGYSVNGATGSAKDYFDDQFNGVMEFSFDVSEIVTLPNTQAYYGANDSDGDDLRPAEMVRDACQLAYEAGIDFSIYDQDGDGSVDNVFVFFAGRDEASGGSDDCIWSHAWYLYSGARITLYLNGVRINRYACSSELNSRNNISGIGTFCHEYSHTLGLPDFYDTDYTGNGSTISAALWGDLSIMDSGNYNNSGNTPPYYNAMERECAGIAVAETLTEGRYTLEPISQNGRFLRMETDTEGEYFLFECRGSSGWDYYLNGTSYPRASGLLVYHVDKSTARTVYSDSYGRNTTPYQRWESHNEVNANPQHQCADLVEANGVSDIISYYGGRYQWPISDLRGLFFPYGGTSLTPTGTPAFTFWSGATSPYSILNISQSGENVTFTVTSGSVVIPTVSNIVTDRYQDAAIITWESSEATSLPAKIVCTGTGFESTQTVRAYQSGKYAAVIEGLSPGTEYKVSICFVYEEEIEGESSTVTFITRSLPRSTVYPYIYLPPSGRKSDGTITSGTKIPLRVMNLSNAESVVWTFAGEEIDHSSDGLADGYYTLTQGGILRADISYKDGSTEIITRTISVR